MGLTSQQITALRTAIHAETDPSVVQWRNPATRDDGSLRTWLNQPSATLAWGENVASKALDEGADYSTFDSIAAGKRDAWAIFLQYGPRDMSKNKNRKVVTDVWGNATGGSTAEAILQAATLLATHAEAYLGGNSGSTGTVTAIKRNWVGVVTLDEVAAILNG